MKRIVGLVLQQKRISVIGTQSTKFQFDKEPGSCRGGPSGRKFCPVDDGIRDMPGTQQWAEAKNLCQVVSDSI